MMPSFKFWRMWLVADSVLILFLGGLLVAMSAAPNPEGDPFTSHLWKGGITDGERQFYAWAMGVWGATLAGWGVTLLFISVYPLKKKEQWTFNCLASSIAIWYPIDTYISFHTGVLLNCALNTVLLLLVLVPLLAIRKEMKK